MNRQKIFCICLALCFFPTYSNPATLTVPGTHSTIASAISALSNGDTLEIAAGTYTQNIVATISDNDVLIQGVGGRAHLNGNGVTISNGKAIFVTTGNNITIENIEFSNAKVADNNGAGIRHEGGLLTIRNCFFHDNENGILTSNQGVSGELVIENSEFNHNGLGSAGYTHNLYVGRIGKLVFKYSYSHHASHGHNIKSRAQQNFILYSRIMDEDSGNASYQIDLPNGGQSYIIGNAIHQSSFAENSTMISYAAEGASNPTQEVYLSGNTLANDRNTANGIRLSGTPLAVIKNNIFDDVSTAVLGSPTEFSNNLECTNCGFVDRDSYDFHITALSPARDGGTEPGTYNGFSLYPTRQYVHPISSEARPDDGTLDIGAFEYGVMSPPPENVNTVPPIFLLLH